MGDHGLNPSDQQVSSTKTIAKARAFLLFSFCKGRRAASRRKKRSKNQDDKRKLVSIKK